MSFVKKILETVVLIGFLAVAVIQGWAPAWLIILLGLFIGYGTSQVWRNIAVDP